jgi:type VI secretion system protein ImpI
MAAALLPPEPEQDLDMTRIRLAPSRPAGTGVAGGPTSPRASGPTPMPVVGSGPVVSGPVPVRPPLSSPSAGPLRSDGPGSLRSDAPGSGAPAVSPAAVSAASAVAADTSSPDLRAAMAAGLGLPTQALDGRDPAELAQELGRLVRSTVDTLRLLLDEQARARLMLGSRRSSDPTQATILQMAGTTDQALRALLASAAVPAVAQAGASLVQHQSRLLEAARAMVRQTGAQLAPSALAALSPGADAAEQLALYAALWHRLGVAPADAPWTEGFEQAALQRLASDYDRP